MSNVRYRGPAISPVFLVFFFFGPMRSVKGIIGLTRSTIENVVVVYVFSSIYQFVEMPVEQ